MKREPYTYMILRYRHDPVAGEQLNVGVILLAPDSRYFGFRFRTTYGRLSKAFSDLDGRVLRQDLASIDRAFGRVAASESSTMFFEKESVANLGHRVIGKDDSSLVWSDVGAGVTADPEKTLNRLFCRFVSQYEDEVASRRSDDDVWRPLRDKLLERQIADIFERKTISTARDEVEFDHAWKNGKWHCIQPLSFDLATPDSIQEKAARWVGHMYGLKGAAETFQPYFVVGKPADDSLAAAFTRAVEFIAEAPMHPKIVHETEFDDFADTLVLQVENHRARS